MKTSCLCRGIISRLVLIFVLILIFVFTVEQFHGVNQFMFVSGEPTLGWTLSSRRSRALVYDGTESPYRDFT